MRPAPRSGQYTRKIRANLEVMMLYHCKLLLNNDLDFYAGRVGARHVPHLEGHVTIY